MQEFRCINNGIYSKTYVDAKTLPERALSYKLMCSLHVVYIYKDDGWSLLHWREVTIPEDNIFFVRGSRNMMQTYVEGNCSTRKKILVAKERNVRLGEHSIAEIRAGHQ
jgi:hypothetical protein